MALMMGPDFRIQLGASKPALRLTLTDADNQPVDLSAVSGVQFKMRLFDATELSIDGVCSVLEDEGPGVVEYDWLGGAPEAVGFYKAIIEVTYSIGEIEPFPGEGYLTIEVTSPLEGV